MRGTGWNSDTPSSAMTGCSHWRWAASPLLRSLWYYAHQQILLYGDAVAHINIARRVLDNRSWLSSFFQLGTVWLPLPHILMLPFVWSKALWTSGIAGSIPTMVAYIVGSLGIFRLVSARAPRGRGLTSRLRFTHSIRTCCTCRARR